MERLCLGGVARVGQVQLLQPFLTILASALFLGEHLTITTPLTNNSIDPQNIVENAT